VREKAIVIVDAGVPPGQLQVGGCVMLSDVDDAELGWSIGAAPIRVSDEDAADELERTLTDRGFEHRRLVDGRVRPERCPNCGSPRVGQWVETDDRYPSWLCSACGTEWTEPT
jgi:hypothetical protein